MARPTRVSFETFQQYDLLHSEKAKMNCGVELNILHPIKETPQYYMGVPVWAHCASTFKKKKKNVDELSVDISVVTTEKTKNFLNEHCWKTDNNGKDDIYATELLRKLYPNKEIHVFYELFELIAQYTHGTFLRYNKDGEITEPTSHDIKRRKYYSRKFVPSTTAPEILELQKKWTDTPNDEEHKELYQQRLSEYIDGEREYLYKHNPLQDTYLDICTKAVCYPVAFFDGTADWSVEKYGKEVGYAKAGEIYFVVTDDAVYFETHRHF